MSSMSENYFSFTAHTKTQSAAAPKQMDTTKKTSVIGRASMLLINQSSANPTVVNTATPTTTIISTSRLEAFM